MQKNQLEECIFSIIGFSGMAKYYASEAVKNAKNGNFEEVYNLLNKSEEEFSKAQDAEGDLVKLKNKTSKECGELILIHSQDHFMGTMSYCELARELVDVYKKIDLLEDKFKKLEKRLD